MTAFDPSVMRPAQIKWYRPRLPQDLLTELNRRSDLAGIVFTALHALLLVATGYACYQLASQGHWVAFALALVAHGAFYSFLGYAGLGHELSHRTVFANPLANDVAFALVSLLTWSNFVYFRKSHHLHHKFTAHDGLDWEVRLPQQSLLPSWRHLVFFDVPFFQRAAKIVIQNAFDVVPGKFGAAAFPPGSQDRKRLVAWARFVLGWHAATMILFAATGLWPLIFIVNLAPFFGTFPNRILAQAQHFGKQPNASDFRLNSRTVLLHPFLAFLYWQMNYHIEHHMYPGVPFFKLKKLRSLIADDLPAPTLGMRALIREMRDHAQKPAPVS